ncbi:MAG: hypothetical protein ABR589_11075 [Chthoniobacterales bacterium]
MAAEIADQGTLSRLSGLELLQYDGTANEYRLDDRIERFIEDMLGAAEVAQADWLTGLIEELRRLIDGYQKLAASAKGQAFVRSIVRKLRTCDSRAQRHLEEIKTVVDLDYRAGSDFEEKLLKLTWHLERARSFGEAIAEMDGLLKGSTFFQVTQSTEVLSLRSRLIRRCEDVGDALIGVYQRIEEYLNRITRDYERARKLIQLRGLTERHEHLTATNISEMAAAAEGPWFRESRFRTLLIPTAVDARPELVARVLAREGLVEPENRRRVQVAKHPPEEVPPMIDWQYIAEAFAGQGDDLFTFLRTVRVEGRLLSDEEAVDGFCSILSNEDENWGTRPFDHEVTGRWEYAVVPPVTGGRS